MDWREVMTRETLQHYAGSRSYMAGVEYARHGAVSGLIVSEQTMTAFVQGTETYEVQLELSPKGGLSADCSCPYGADGNFCKHCVAVGIAWLEDTASIEGASAPTFDIFQKYLEKQDQVTLVSLLLEQIRKDTDLQNQILLQIAQASPDAPDMNAFRKTIRRTCAVSDYLEYGEVYSYVSGVETVVHYSALEWAEKGRAAFPDHTEARLRDFLVEEYTRQERYDEAYAILWERFQKRPALPAYQLLSE